jgi:hypothetical protein
VIVFNFAHCVENAEFLKRLYAPYFKHILFFSDIDKSAGLDHQHIATDAHGNEIIYLEIERGAYAYRAISYALKRQCNTQIDFGGVFFIMDDNVLNVSLLDALDSSKIVYEYHDNLYQLNEFNSNDWHWASPSGLAACRRLVESEKFKELAEFNGFCDCRNIHTDPDHCEHNLHPNAKHATRHPAAGFADYFFLPRHYISSQFFWLLDFFEESNVFLEIAIPTIIANLEREKSRYLDFDVRMLHYHERDLSSDESFLRTSFIDEFKLMIHPIKISKYPSIKGYLQQIFSR